jgi:hypothetical protein
VSGTRRVNGREREDHVAVAVFSFLFVLLDRARGPWVHDELCLHLWPILALFP